MGGWCNLGGRDCPIAPPTTRRRTLTNRLAARSVFGDGHDVADRGSPDGRFPCNVMAVRLCLRAHTRSRRADCTDRAIKTVSGTPNAPARLVSSRTTGLI